MPLSPRAPRGWVAGASSDTRSPRGRGSAPQDDGATPPMTKARTDATNTLLRDDGDDIRNPPTSDGKGQTRVRRERFGPTAWGQRMPRLNVPRAIADDPR